MAMNIVMAGVMPHPPIVIPEVGGAEAKKVDKTARAMAKLAQRVAEAHPDTLIVVGPHGPVFADAVAVLKREQFRGDLSGFGAAGTEQVWDGNQTLADAIVEEANARGVTAVAFDEKLARRFGSRQQAAGLDGGSGVLDHGMMVPLYFLKAAGLRAKLVPVGIGMLPYLTLYDFGEAVRAAAERLGERVAFVASGDLSHRLAPGAPAGYNPRGVDFDRQVVEALAAADPSRLLALDPDLIEAAGECGFRPITMLLGALEGEGVDAEVLSYEGPFGVGYGVVSLKPTGKPDQARLYREAMHRGRAERAQRRREGEHPLVQLARQTVDTYVRTGRRPKLPAPGELTPEMKRPAGVFVSLHKEGQLRGCIGTTGPTTSSVAEEIIQNGVSAAARDPRFRPVEEDELDDLTISVDVLGEPEPVRSERDLDPKRYGVIVRKGSRSGLLLPDLEGVDTVEEQLRIAKQKAGISPQEKDVELERFEVVRYK